MRVTGEGVFGRRTEKGSPAKRVSVSRADCGGVLTLTLGELRRCFHFLRHCQDSGPDTSPGGGGLAMPL